MEGEKPYDATSPGSCTRSLSRDERRDWLRLIRSHNVGPATFHDLLQHFGNVAVALEQLPQLASKGGKRSVRICSLDDAEREIDAVEKFGGQVVALDEPAYPAWLARIDAPPPVIAVKGDTLLAARPAVAIVGARNGSAIGQKLARQIAAGLGESGFTIVSGMARGIDTAAHSASLDTGTIAVLAGGIDNIYPPENEDLYNSIGISGLLVSERPFGFRPQGKDFPRRNRLISGISAGVVVIEAAQRSGSLITARLAGEQGREVFAVPGNPLDPRSAGTNRLLTEGATLVTSASDIVGVLEPIVGRTQLAARQNISQPAPENAVNEPADVADSDRNRILQALGPSPVDIDELIRLTGLPARQVHAMLLELDLAGKLERHGQQLVSLHDSG